MIVGCYTLDVYCESPVKICQDQRSPVFRYKCFGQFTGQTERECRAKAKRAGWVLRDGRVRCPPCAKSEEPDAPSTPPDGRG